MKDKTSLLFLTVIGYSTLVLGVVSSRPLAAPAVTVASLAASPDPGAAVASPSHQHLHRHHHRERFL
jgi:hypothetical protein